jgi:hypothetical protein
MALTVKKKSSYIFSPPSYIKKSGSLESKVEKMINDTIKQKIFNLLDINRVIYLKKIEYFPIFTVDEIDKEKVLKSIMMRIKNRHMRFREISLKEIELSGITLLEFNSFLITYGAKENYNSEEILENL